MHGYPEVTRTFSIYAHISVFWLHKTLPVFLEITSTDPLIPQRNKDVRPQEQTKTKNEAKQLKDRKRAPQLMFLLRLRDAPEIGAPGIQPCALFALSPLFFFFYTYFVCVFFSDSLQ